MRARRSATLLAACVFIYLAFGRVDLGDSVASCVAAAFPYYISPLALIGSHIFDGVWIVVCLLWAGQVGSGLGLYDRGMVWVWGDRLKLSWIGLVVVVVVDDVGGFRKIHN